MSVRIVNNVVFSCGGEQQTPYQQLEKQYGSGVNRRLINGVTTGCGKCVGFCKYQEHPGFLTKDLRREHNCIGKGCFYYVPKKGGYPRPYAAHAAQTAFQL